MTPDEYKAHKKGSRDANLDNGFRQEYKIHVNKKKYKREKYNKE